MEPVFISYRHDDGDVVRVVEERVHQFDCFVDKGISAGADWSQNVSDAARSCKVFLVAIGKHWVEQRGRFEDPEDWVRKELEIVLNERPPGEVLVIPILFTVDEKDVLTPVTADQSRLGWLFGRKPLLLEKADALNKKLFKHQAKRLLDHEAEILQSIERALRPSRPEQKQRPQTLVPYLCDREPAELEIKRRIERVPRPDFVVAHGYDREEHARFIDRLNANGKLERFFSSRVGVEVRPLPWGHDTPGEGGFAELIEFALEKQLVESESTRTLTEALAALPRPQIFILEVSWADRLKLGPNLIEGLLQAFRQTISRLAPAAAGRLLLWINVTYDQPAGQDLTEKEIEALKPLPRLTPVEATHFKEWIRLPEVETYLSNEVRSRLEPAMRTHLAAKPLHMLDFALAVENAREGKPWDSTITQRT